MVVAQLGRTEVQGTIKRRLVTSLLCIIYRDLKPYILLAAVVMVLTCLSCIGILLLLVAIMFGIRLPAVQQLTTSCT